MNEQLPDGWVESSLDEIADWSSGGTPDTKNKVYYDGDIAWVVTGDLTDGYVRTSYKTITQAGLDNSSAKIVPIGSVLIAMYGASIGRLGIADFECATNQAIAYTKKIYGGISNWFLFYFLQAKKEEIISLGVGGAQPNISQTILKEITIPLPPLAEQTRIVAALDGLLGRVRTAQAQLATVPKLLKRFRQGVLTAAVSGKLTEDWRDENPGVESVEKTLKQVREQLIKDKVKADLTMQNHLTANHENENWISIKLGFLTKKGDIFDGPFGSNLKSSDYVEEGVRVIRLENIGVLKFIAEKETYISHEKYKTLERHTVMGGDLLVSSFIVDNVRCVILPRLDTKAIAKADCFCIRPIDSLIDKQYLSFFLSGEIAFSELVSHIHGATRPRINTTQLKELEISLPPIAEQQEIVRRLSSLLTWADKLEEGYKAAKRQLDAMRAAILTKAFAGELTEQNPADEPASVLLARIRAKRSGKAPKPKPAKNRTKAGQVELF